MNISDVVRLWRVNRGLLTVSLHEAGLISRRSEQAGAQQAMFLPVTLVEKRTRHRSVSRDIASGRLEIEIAGGMTVMGSVAPDFAQAIVAALRACRKLKLARHPQLHRQAQMLAFRAVWCSITVRWASC